MDRGLLIGVDGGGTHTRAIAVRPDGSIAAAAAGSGMNYHNIGLAAARRNLQAIVDDLLARCGASSYTRLTVGLSALDSAADDETRARFAGDLFDPEKLDLESDAYTALMGVTLGGPGAITICGTGSMLLMLDENGVQHVSGGWGHALGDVGSSYTMAVEGLRAAINAWEGTGAATELCEEALKFYHIAVPRALIDKVYNPSVEPGRLAQFARVVLSLAAQDTVAYDIVRGNMTRLAHQTVALLKGHEGINRIILGWMTGAGLNAVQAFDQDLACVNVLDFDLVPAASGQGTEIARRIIRAVNMTPYNYAKHGMNLTSLEFIFEHYEERPDEADPV